MDLRKICEETRKIVLQTGDFIQKEVGKVGSEAIEVKSLNSLVSYVDKNAEHQLVEQLGKLLPGSTFITEEETVEQKQGDLKWVIDPLDGTTNFLHGLPCFAVSVALQEHDKTILGVVLEVNRAECFYAWKGGGAYLNGQNIQVSSRSNLDDTLLATGFPYHDFERLEQYLNVFKNLLHQTRGLRRWGAAAVDLAYVACGRFDGFFEYNLNTWDIAAGALIIQEAGGKVGDFQGGDQFGDGMEVVASNAHIFDQLIEVIRPAFHS